MLRCPSSLKNASMYDPISQDPPHDSDFPAGMYEFEFSHFDALINGVIFHPAGEEKHPLIILLHGLPGHERNLDLAHILHPYPLLK